MERRDWSLKSLQELIYIDSLDDEQRASGLQRWVETYLEGRSITDIDLPTEQLKQLSELFYKNVDFLKRHRENQRRELMKMSDLKKFLNH
ncbi:MAG: hypothetical protein U9N30_01505 [Campylobacterota bacterium]|nr:hypothetical protein [Campylobacterota bacterium]